MNKTMYQYYDAIQPPETLLPRLLTMEPEPRRETMPWRVVVPTAACLALMAVAAGLLLSPKQAEPVSLSHPTPQTIQQTSAPDTAETTAPEVGQTPELTAEAQWPSIDECIYEHTDDGDFLTLVIHGAEDTASETIDITGQLVDGQYVGHTQLAGIDEIIYLTVFEDGSYAVRFEGIPREPQKIPEMSSSSKELWPAIVKGEYVHTEQGDYLVFTDVETGVSETYDITAELRDGYYHGYIQHPLIKPEVTLRVHDGTYDLEYADIRDDLDNDAEGTPINENGIPCDVDENGNPLDRNGVPIDPN